MKKAGQIMGNILIILSILMIGFLLIPLIPVADQWYQLAIVKSASMEPWLPVGSLAIYQPQPDYYTGDVIAYEIEQNGQLIKVMHRLVNKEVDGQQNLFFTQGDATQHIDPIGISKEQIKGKLIYSIPKFGYIISGAQSTTAISLLIFICLIILVISELRH